MIVRSALATAPLTDRSVFLRADLNVPLSNGAIASDFRLQALKPTLDLLVQKKARIIIGTHLGRPHDSEATLSTRILLNWFVQHGYTICFAETMQDALIKRETLNSGSVLLLENLRFFKGEQSKDEAALFAQKLASLASYYVNDAFALLHRSDTSITLLPELYTQANKTIGLLIEKEIETLTSYFTDALSPLVLMLGGGKVKDKLPYLEKLLDKADTILFLPALSCTFTKALGKNMGKSLVEESLRADALDILNRAQKKGVKLCMPTDYVISTNSLTGPLSIVDDTDFPDNGIALSVGPKTCALYEKILMTAGTIYTNGAMGLHERPETMKPFYTLLNALAHSPASSIIGGGDSVLAVYEQHLENKVTYCSTGGGASLYLLAYGTLPTLKYVLADH